MITRFIDKDPEFLFVSGDRVIAEAEISGAIPYDVPNVELSHVGDECSFVMFLKKYELTNPALQDLLELLEIPLH
nr:chromate resistance protein ChrB domain-containing protein [Nitrosomonas supralitoralis]